MANVNGSAEAKRLSEADDGTAPWLKWEPYLSERQWGTDRRDQCHIRTTDDDCTADPPVMRSARLLAPF